MCLPLSTWHGYEETSVTQNKRMISDIPVYEFNR